MENQNKSSKLKLVALADTIAIFFLLVLGNVVSSFGAGLACPDWPLCHGRIIPPLRADVLLEYFHRLAGLVVAILTVTLCIMGIRSRQGFVKKASVLILVLLVIQIFLGGAVVLLKLPFHLTTLHLVIAFVILSLVCSIWMIESGKKFYVSGAFKVFLILLAVQIILGGLVRHTGAGTACPFFPHCYEGFFPPPTEKGILNFIHRWNGILTAVISTAVGKLFVFLTSLQAIFGILVSTDFNPITRSVHAGFGYLVFLISFAKAFK